MTVTNTTTTVVIPNDPNDLVCDTCPQRFPWKGELFHTLEAARVKGWHIYREVKAQIDRTSGARLGQVVVDQRVLCPQCVGTPRSKLPPAPEVLEGQADLLDDLHFEVKVVEKEKKQPKRGVN